METTCKDWQISGRAFAEVAKGVITSSVVTDSATIATVYGSDNKELEERLRLIAAAPELLEAAINLVAFLENNYDHNPAAMEYCSEAIEAIKKATKQ